MPLTRALPFVSSFLALGAAALAPAQVTHVDAHGREWREVFGTTGQSWNAVAAVLPADGVTPASGALSGMDVTGFVWARQADVRAMFAEFEPALLTSPSVSGSQYVLSALGFFSAFRPTFEFYTTFGGYNYILGWTSDRLLDHGGLASASAQYPVFDGHFDVTGTAPVADPNTLRGVWMYRPAPVGTVDCAPAAPNSTGVGASIHAVGSTSLAHGDLVLHATELPPNATGFFLCSTTTAVVPLAGGGQGTLCLGGAIGRFSSSASSSGAAGRIALRIDPNVLPAPTGAVSAQVGESWSFQAWYRDANPAVTSNLTPRVTVTFS